MRKLIFAALLFSLPAYAGWGEFEYDFDQDVQPWKEIEAKLPASPKLDEAIPLFVSAATDNEFFVDPKSISVGEDGVVRYTMIVRSPSGALNVSFEGIRCSSHEKKLYAFWRPDGSWSRNKYAKWSRIEFKNLNRQHHMLSDDFFCPGRIMVRDADEAIYALKRGIHPSAER